MRMAAEDTVRLACGCIRERSLCHLVAQPQPARAEAIEPTRHPLLLAIESLRHLEKLLEEAAQQDVLVDETVELVPMDGQVALSAVLPHIALVDGYADQV